MELVTATFGLVCAPIAAYYSLKWIHKEQKMLSTQQNLVDSQPVRNVFLQHTWSYQDFWNEPKSRDSSEINSLRIGSVMARVSCGKNPGEVCAEATVFEEVFRRHVPRRGLLGLMGAKTFADSSSSRIVSEKISFEPSLLFKNPFVQIMSNSGSVRDHPFMNGVGREQVYGVRFEPTWDLFQAVGTAASSFEPLTATVPHSFLAQDWTVGLQKTVSVLREGDVLCMYGMFRPILASMTAAEAADLMRMSPVEAARIYEFMNPSVANSSSPFIVLRPENRVSAVSGFVHRRLQYSILGVVILYIAFKATSWSIRRIRHSATFRFWWEERKRSMRIWLARRRILGGAASRNSSSTLHDESDSVLHHRIEHAGHDHELVESATARSDVKCVACFERPVELVFLPCGHACFCRWCELQYKDQGPEIETCPFCRTPVESTTRVFFPSILESSEHPVTDDGGQIGNDVLTVVDDASAVE
eukprot:ANDGO_03259.mRNA.1 hypothetical protein